MDNIKSSMNGNYNINYNTNSNSNNLNIPSITTQKINRISEMTNNLAEVETLDFDSDSTIIPKIKNYTKEEYSKTVAEYTKELEQQKNMYKEAVGELDKIIAAIEYNLPNDPKLWIGKYKSKYDLEELKTISKEFKNFGSIKQLQDYKETLEQDRAKLEASIYKINQTIKSAEFDMLDSLDEYQKFKNPKLYDQTQTIKIDFRQLYSKVYEGNLEAYCSINNIDINKINELGYVKMLKQNVATGYNLYYNSYYKDSDIDLLLQLNDQELIKKYNYCFETFGREKANEYLESISDTLHQQVGYIKAQEYLSTLKTDENGNYDNGAIINYLNTIIKGGKTGWESFFNGISAWGESETIYSADEYESMYILQALQQNQSFSNFLDNSFELSQSAGNMLPSVLIGTLTANTALATTLIGNLTANTALATTLMGISSGGSSYHSALVSGHDKKEAIFYGTLSGLSEATLQYFLGGIPGLKQADDVAVKGFKGFCKEMSSEALEEGVQTVLDTSLQTTILGEEFTAEQLTKDVLKSAIYGAIMSGTFNTATTATSKLGNKVISAIKNKNNTTTNTNSPTIDNQVNQPTNTQNNNIQNIQSQNKVNNNLNINKKITINPNTDLQQISWNNMIESAKGPGKGNLILEVIDISNIPYNLFSMLQSDNGIRIKVGDRVYKLSEIDSIMKNYIADMESGKTSLEDQYNFWNKQGILIQQLLNDYINTTEYKLAVQLKLRNQNGYQQAQEKADKIWGELNDIESKCENLKSAIQNMQSQNKNNNELNDNKETTDNSNNSSTSISWSKEIEKAKNSSDSNNPLVLEVNDGYEIPYDLFNKLKSDNGIRLKIDDKIYKPSEFDSVIKNYIEEMENGKISITEQYNFWNKQYELKLQQIKDYQETANNYQMIDKMYEELNEISTKCNNLKSTFQKMQLPKKNESSYLEFSKEYTDSIMQLSNYYGDAGRKINLMYLDGKTTNQIIEELDEQNKIDFQNFLQNTIEGRYLASLSEEEIKALTTYTGGSYYKINGILRAKIKNIFCKINGIKAKKLIQNIDNAIGKYGGLDEKTVLYRAVDVKAFTSQNSTYAAIFKGINSNDLNQVYGCLKVLEGKNFGDLGYMSSSPGYSTSFAKNYDCPIVLEILAEKGTAGAYINQISEFHNTENEFLLARNTELQMVEVMLPEKDINGLEKIIIKCIIK